MQNILVKSKKGAMGTGGVLAIVFAVVIVAGLVFWVSQSQIGDGETPTGCPESTGKLTVNSFSALSKSTNVTPTLTAGIKGSPVTTPVTSGTTTFTVGADLEIHASLGDYIDTKVEGKMACGGLTVDNPMYYSTSDNPSIRIKNDDGDYMTDAIGGGAVNQTSVAAGETINLVLEVKGTSQESSGDGVYVIEFPASTSANITKVELDGQGSIAIPSVHTTLNAGSKVVAFEVPAVVGSTSKTMDLTITLGSAKDLTGGVYTDWYSKQWFVDTDGQIKYGIENADGTLKYENSLDYDFYINN